MSDFTTRIEHVNGIAMEFLVHGEGEPVLFIHGAMTEAYVPLWKERGLSAAYQIIGYARRGYGRSERAGTIDIPSHAADCVALLDRLGIERAHIVGHSYGPLIALELALNHAARVHSLVLFETAVPAVLLTSPEVGVAANETYARYQRGDVAGAFDTFFSAFLGPDFRTLVNAVLPAGAIERAIADMKTLLENDFPALQTWSFGAQEAARIACPTLLVVGESSQPLFHEAHRQMQLMLPDAESITLPRATHALFMQSPGDAAQAMADFFARHPLRVYA